MYYVADLQIEDRRMN